MPKRHVLCDNPYIPMGGLCKEEKCRGCQWMEEPECKYCHDTGDMGQGYLDCGHCNAAMVITRYEATRRD